MGKKRLFGIIALFLVFVIAPYACAEIEISDLEHVYNLGDKISVDFNIYELKTMSGMAKTTLICENETDYFNSLLFGIQLINIQNGEKEYLKFELPLSEEIVREKILLGDCYVRINLEDLSANTIENENSNEFIISDKINITANLNKDYFLPGETIEVSGIAIKMNDEIFEGNAVLWLNEGKTVDVDNGAFSGTVDIEKNIKSGKHNFLVSARDNDGNIGELIKEISIIPVQTELNIDLDNNEVNPEEIITINSELYDQAGDRIANDILFVISSPDGKQQFSKLSITGSDIKYKLPRAAMSGDWKVEAKTDVLTKAESLYVKKYASVDISFSEGMVIVENIGNIPYTKPVEISFKQNEEIITKVIDVNLDVGKTESYVLEAPEGEYDIAVETSDNEKTFDGISLTGKAIDVVELSQVQKEARIKNIIMAASLIGIALVIILGVRLLQMRKEDMMKNELNVLNNHVNKIKQKYSL